MMMEKPDAPDAGFTFLGFALLSIHLTFFESLQSSSLDADLAVSELVVTKSLHTS